MIAFLNQIPSEAKIKKQLRKIIFGKNIFCPFCRSRRVYVSENRYRCRRCRKPFSLLSGTWLKDIKISLRTFYALLWCWTQKVPVLQTEKFCHLSEKTVTCWVPAVSPPFAPTRAHSKRSGADGRGLLQRTFLAYG